MRISDWSSDVCSSDLRPSARPTPVLVTARIGQRPVTPDAKDPSMVDTPNNKDDAKGRIKEAAGNLTGDKDLENEGKVDRAVGGVKDAADKAADKVKDVFRKD